MASLACRHYIFPLGKNLEPSHNKLVKKNLFNYLFGLIILLALFLRLPLLNDSFWLDEAAQALESIRPLSQQLNIAEDFQPPLLHLILHFASLFGTSEWWLRGIGALIPGLITIFFTIKITQKLFNEKIALLTGLLLATNSFHIYFSQELRPYSLPTMWAILSWWRLIKLADKKENNWLKKIDFIYVIESILGLFSSYLYPFLLFSQLVYLWLKNPRQIKLIFTNSFLIVLGFLPWLPKFIEQFKVGQNLRLQMPGWEDVVSLSQLKALPLILGKFFYGVINLDFYSWQTLLLLILSFILLFNFLFHLKALKKDHHLQQSLLIVVIWLFVPILTAWLVSFFVPVLSPKRVLFCLPAFTILLGVSIFFPQKNFKKITWILAALILIINLTNTYQYFTQPVLQRENWRSLHQQITQRFNPNNTAIIFAFTAPFAPWQWYDQNTYPILTTQTYLLTENDLPSLEKNLKQLDIQQIQSLIVFDYLRDLTDPQDLLIRTIKDYGWQDGGFFTYPNLGLVRIYQKNYNLSYAHRY